MSLKKLKTIEGSGGKGGHVPTEYPDTLSSRQSIKLLFALGEGELQGIDEVLLNKAPIGNFSSYGASYDWRSGTSGQTIIDGFTNAEAPIPAFSPANLNFNEPIYITVPPQANAVRLTLTVSGLALIANNGDTVYYWTFVSIATIAYPGALEIDIGVASEIGKHSSQYSWDTMVTRPSDANPNLPWFIRLKRATWDDSYMGQKFHSATSVTSAIQVFWSSLNYPNTALLSITLNNASAFGGRVPDILFKVKGEKIYLPSNYNPSTRVYSGAWDGNFKNYTEYTNNPVWHLLSVLTKYVEINIADIDIGKFYTVAQYADGVVSDGKGGTEYRYTINKQFSTRQSVPVFLTQILTLVNCSFTTNTFGQISLYCDMPGQPIEDIVGNADVIDGEFIYFSNSVDTRYTVANVTYEEPIFFGGANTITADASDINGINYIDRYGIQTTDILHTGCTSSGQALRKARWALWVNTVDTSFISYKKFLQGLVYEVGMLVKVYDNRSTTTTCQGRIVSVTNTDVDTYEVVLDRKITVYGTPLVNKISFWNQSAVLTESLTMFPSTGENAENLQTNTILITSTTQPLTSSLFIQEVFKADSSPYIPVKTYKVISIQKEEHLYNITAVIHSEDKYDWIDDIGDIPDGGYTNTDDYHRIPPPVYDVSATEYLTPVFKLTIDWSWTPPIGISETVTYTVLWRRDTGSYTSLTGLTTESIDILSPVPGNYQFIITAVDTVSGLPSSAVNFSVAYGTSSNTSPLFPPINLNTSV